jgi:hypothetical protein
MASDAGRTLERAPAEGDPRSRNTLVKIKTLDRACSAI